MWSFKENFITETIRSYQVSRSIWSFKKTFINSVENIISLETSGTARGVNMPVVFANIFMAKIEEETTSKCYELLITDKINYCLI